MILKKPNWPTFAPEPSLTPAETRDVELLEDSEEELEDGEELGLSVDHS